MLTPQPSAINVFYLLNGSVTVVSDIIWDTWEVDISSIITNISNGTVPSDLGGAIVPGSITSKKNQNKFYLYFKIICNLNHVYKIVLPLTNSSVKSVYSFLTKIFFINYVFFCILNKS